MYKDDGIPNIKYKNINRSRYQKSEVTARKHNTKYQSKQRYWDDE